MCIQVLFRTFALACGWHLEARSFGDDSTSLHLETLALIRIHCQTKSELVLFISQSLLPTFPMCASAAISVMYHLAVLDGSCLSCVYSLKRYSALFISRA